MMLAKNNFSRFSAIIFSLKIKSMPKKTKQKTHKYVKFEFLSIRQKKAFKTQYRVCAAVKVLYRTNFHVSFGGFPGGIVYPTKLHPFKRYLG